ncbi:MAG: glycosyltransferase [Ferruginibacter sp.]
MKNVLWLVSWYPNRLDKLDGDFIQRHAKAVALFCKVHVIYIKKDDSLPANTTSTENYRSGNLTEQVIYYNSSRTGMRFLDRFISQLKYDQCYRESIRKYIAQNGKPDHVHVHVAMKAGLAALWIKKKWNIPFIVTEHWTGYHVQASPSVYNYGLLFRRMNRKILKEAALFLPVSSNLGETVKQNFVNIPYTVVPNVVDTGLFYFKPVNLIKFRFIHVSNMTYQKNPENIFKACSLLEQKGYDFEMLMLGAKDEMLLLKAKAHNLDERIVFFKDPVPYAEVAVQMQNSSALLLFSRFENLPCVILEALCCGLPVISSDVGGIAEVIDETNGILVENGNTEQLVKAMQQVMDNYGMYDRSAIAAKAAEKFNYDTVGNLYLHAYNNTP